MEASTCKVRTRLEQFLETFPGYAGQFDTTYGIGEDRVVAVTLGSGHRVSYRGPEGVFVVHRSPNSDIIFSSTHSLGNVDGVSRNCGTLQGIDSLPSVFNDIIGKILEANPKVNVN